MNLQNRNRHRHRKKTYDNQRGKVRSRIRSVGLTHTHFCKKNNKSTNTQYTAVLNTL